MTNFTAFNYSNYLDSRDKSKIYETQEFEKSTTDQDFVSMSELVENGVHGVLHSGFGRKKVMPYNDVIEPVEGFDLSDYNPSLVAQRDVYIQNSKNNNNKESDNVINSQSNFARDSVLDKVESGKEKVSSSTSES